MPRGAYLLDLGRVGYGEAWALQRSLAAAVGQGAIPDTVLLLEHPPTVTLGRRTDPDEVHLPAGVEVEVVETDRGGRCSQTPVRPSIRVASRPKAATVRMTASSSKRQ